MKAYTYTAIEPSETVNHAIDVWLLSAKEDGLLTNEDVDKLSVRRVVLSDKKNLFSTLFKSIARNTKDDSMRIEVVTVRTNDEVSR